jgi:Fur family ferric uptake transcriptional regulator
MHEAILRSARHELLRAHVRVTSPRVMVLAVLRQRPHATADDLLDLVAGETGAISRQGIYDVLTTLVDAGLARRIEPAGHPSRYEIRVGDNHHHVVCRACGRVADVDCVVGVTPCLEPSSRAGYTVDEAEVIFWGRCPDCQSAEN